jgi:murein DD-endopeptidase MepM/ murein hydrolase activator NlpD
MAFSTAVLIVITALARSTPAEATHGYFAPFPANFGYYVTQPAGDLEPFNCPDSSGQYWSHCFQPDYYAYDFGMSDGNIVVASHTGQVIRLNVGNNVGGCSSAYAPYANYITLDRGNGYSTGYWHLQYASAMVTQWQTVIRSTQLARSDSTGWTCGAHLHFFLMTTPDIDHNSTPSVWLDFDDIGRPGLGAFVISGNSN